MIKAKSYYYIQKLPLPDFNDFGDFGPEDMMRLAYLEDKFRTAFLAKALGARPKIRK